MQLILKGFSFYICLVSLASAQQPWEQVFPRLATRHYIAEIVHWNGDTVFAAGTQFTLLRSIDAGQTWVNMFTHNPGFDFVRMGTDGRYLYLLPYYATKNFFNDFLRDSLQHFLLRYDVRTGDTTRITFPNPNGSPRYLFVFDLSVTQDCITILTSGDGASLIQSTDFGATWSVRNIADSIYEKSVYANRVPTVLFKNRKIGVILTYQHGNFITYITYDGGLFWKPVSEVVYPGSTYLYSFPKRPGTWVNDSTLILVTESNVPIISTDTGRTWTRKEPLPAMIHSIHLSSDGNGYAVGRAYEVFKTTDWWRTNVQVQSRHDEITNRFTGCMVGRDHFIVGGHWGTLPATSDGGVTWNDELPKVYFQWFEFFTETEGVSVYKDITTGEFIYGKTTDGGKTWRNTTNLISTELGNDIRHLTKDIAFCYPGGAFNREKLIYRTTDAGITWMESYVIDSSDTIQIIFDSFGKWNRLHDRVAFVPTNRGLLVSKDQGQNWVLKESIKQMTAHDIWRSDMSQADSWVMMRDCSIYRSTDAGDTWMLMYSVPDSIDFRIPISINAVSEEEIIALMNLRTDISRTYLMRSTDKGQSWSSRIVNDGLSRFIVFPSGVAYGYGGRGEIVYTPQHYFARSSNLWISYSLMIDYRGDQSAYFFFLDENVGWFAGRYYLLHTTNGGISWTELPLPGTKSVSLQPSYPNPVSGSGSTTIPFTVTGNREVHVRIEVHDLLGRKVATVHDNSVQPGSHSALWVTHGVSPGMYFVRIAGAESEVRKVVVR